MSRSALAKVHIAKKELGLDDDTYRALLLRVVGAESCAGLSEAKIGRVLDELKRLGWKPPAKRRLGAEAAKMYALWCVLADHGHVENRSVKALEAYARRMTGIARLDWIKRRDATLVIESLKQWLRRVGLEGELA